MNHANTVTNVINDASQIVHFDGVLHWCILISLFIFLIGMLWVTLRVLLPLRRLAKQAASIIDGKLPEFDTPSSGIWEVEQLRRSLQHMIGQIKQAQEREIVYRNALTESQETERLRIAREIHDDTIQSLVVVAHSLERAAHPIKALASDASVHLDTARAQLIRCIDGLRQLIANLRPTVLDELGLAAAIEILCEDHPNLEFSVAGCAYEIDHAQELALFRAAQEAICNAERHALAHRITATLIYAPAAVTLEVSDDGRGFELPRQLQEFASYGHFGLLGIRERMAHLGGQFKVASEPAAGTRITVSVPRAALAAA